MALATITVSTSILNNNIQIISISGKMRMKDTTELENIIIGLLSKGQIQILLDFSQTNYINSRVIATIVNYARETQKKGGDIKIIKPSKKVYEILSLGEFDRFLSIYNSEQEAIDQFSTFNNT